MLEGGKVSSMQVAVIMYPVVLSTALLSVPSATAKVAQNDVWLSTLLGSWIGWLCLFLAFRLHQMYPNKTLVQYADEIVGKIPGKLISLVFLLFVIHSTGIIAREFAEFVVGNFFLNTPVLVITCAMILLCGIAVKGGVELVVRSAQILTPLFLLPSLFLLLLIPDLHLKNLLPFFEHGIEPIWKGALPTQAWFSEFFLVSFFLPFLVDSKKGRKWILLSMLVATVSILFTVVILYALFGIRTGTIVYPILIAFRYISVTDFFENLEALFLSMWVVGNFVKIAVFYYVSALSTAQWLNLTSYRPLVLPLGVLILVCSQWQFPNTAAIAQFLHEIVPAWVVLANVGLPLLLWVVALMRKRKGQSKEQRS